MLYPRIYLNVHVDVYSISIHILEETNRSRQKK
jgi:hypothetical protein